MACNCPNLNKENSADNQFEPNCVAEVFKTYYNNLNPEIEKYLDHINNINDSVLQYISIYLVQYYIDGHRYFGNAKKSHRLGACGYLKKWLQKQKDLFTYGEKCKTKTELWKKNIPTLWNKIKMDYTTLDNKETVPWCNYFDLYDKTSFPSWLTLNNCEEKNYQEPCSEVHIPKITTDCECPKNEVSLIPSEPVQAPEADRTKNLAVTSGFTAAGTLGTLFFLYRFTPMMSWFRRPGMNNVGTDLYMNPGGAESFLSMQQANGSNNLFYHP